ncbi:MAG: alpha/beta hydrolase-fold protein [bacterium]
MSSVPSNVATIVRDTMDINPGITCYTVTSAYQQGPNKLEVLLPNNYDASHRYGVTYLLPVNTGTDGEWGSSVVEAQKQNLHNMHGMIFVSPAYDTVPWFGDHPTRPEVRQSQYLLEVIIPFIDQMYSTIAEAAGRVVLGFSKSGLGSLSLFMRNLDTFGKVVAFEPYLVPFSQEIFRTWGIVDSYATRENFDDYNPLILMDKKRKELQQAGCRIVLLCGGLSGPGMRLQTDILLARLKDADIPYTYIFGAEISHDWRSGWMQLAVAATAIPERIG